MTSKILLSSEILGEIDYEACLREETFFYKISTRIYHFKVIGFLWWAWGCDINEPGGRKLIMLLS